MYVPPNKNLPGLKARSKALREQAIAKANAEAKAKVENSVKPK
jgi:hypothetical protein